MKQALPVLTSPTTSRAGACGSRCHTHAVDHEQTRRLEELRRELGEIVARGRTAQAAARGNGTPAPAPSDELTLSRHEALPLVPELTHRLVDDKYVWVGVRQGTVAVLSSADHELMLRLRAGVPPSRVQDALGETLGLSEADAWGRLSDLLGRLAASGLIQGIQGHHEHKAATPERFARFHLTQACQLQCTHCYADSSPYVDRSGELSTERWRRLAIDFAANGGEQVLFTGGEALIHRGCLELMRTCKENGLYVTLFTNGILVARHAREIHKWADKVQVSLDGPNAETNDEIRGRGMFQKILRAIDLLLEQGTPTRIGMTVAPSRWETWRAEFSRIAERYARYPHVEFKLSYGIMQYGRGTSIDASAPNDRETIDWFIDRVNGHEGPKVTRFRSGCGYGEQLVVGPTGTVYPCHLLDAPVCHIDDYPVPEIISVLRGLIGQVDVDHVEGCNTCEIRYLCGGGCRVLGSRQTGSRLVTTCTPADKLQKYRNLVRGFSIH